MRNNLSDVLTGVISMGHFVIALFFLRFWRSARDRFFLYFALSFGIEGAHRLVSALSYDDNEDSPLHYLVRLLAYGLILWAIMEKNLPVRGARRSDGR
jgi:uncharacterized membrane protein HdeD (DUF308 family)